MCFNQVGSISSLNGKFLKLVDQFTSSSESDVYIRIGKAWTAMERLITMKKSNLPVEIKLPVTLQMYAWTT